MPGIRLCKDCGIEPAVPRCQCCPECRLATGYMSDQIRAAHRRLEEAPVPHRARIPEAEWPEGRRWCAGCQTMVLLIHTRGARCKACASEVAHAAMLMAKYGMTAEEYGQRLEDQGWVCKICHNSAARARLAVDHDHRCCKGGKHGRTCGRCTRGLLCSRCNQELLGAAYHSPELLERAALYLRAAENRMKGVQ